MKYLGYALPEQGVVVATEDLPNGPFQLERDADGNIFINTYDACECDH
jgi:hypothetical protein